jgi:hypothetical protein
VWLWKLREIFAAIVIGDGTVGLIVLRERPLLPAGPQGAHKVARFFADNPNCARLLGLTQIGLGVWAALRQYWVR